MKKSVAGNAYGLAWTPSGSQLIQIKTTVTKGTGKIAIDCDVGHDFLVSLECCVEFLQTEMDFDLRKLNIKVTIPGSLEGPSAGLPLLISLHSALTKQPVNQSMAFTGQLLESGVITGVAEIKSKLWAAQRGNLRAVVFPLQNLPEIPTIGNCGIHRTNLFLAPIGHATEALKLSLP